MKTTSLSLAFLFTLTVNTFAQHGVTSPWQPTAVQLPKANPTYAAYTTVGHTMVVDKQGKIYVFYTEFDMNNQATERLYINTSTDGINWTPTIFPPAQNFKPGYYNVAIDTANNIHVVWVKAATKQLHYSKYDYNLSQWAINTVISDTIINGVIRGTTVTVDRKMRVHVAWIDGLDDSVTSEIMYKRSPDNGISWDNQQNISNTPGYPSCWQQGDFTGTLSDTLAYVWRENTNPSGNDWDLRIAYTTNGGVNWQTRICSTASGSGHQRDPVLAVLKDGSVIIAYEYWPQGFWGYKKIYAGKSNNIVTTDPSFTQISDTVQSELLIDGYDYNNNLYYAFWKWRFATEAPNHMDIAGKYFNNSTSSWSNSTANNGVEWCTDIGSAELGYKKCAIGPDGKVHLLYGTPPTGMASLYYTYRTSPAVGISTFNYPTINSTLYPNPFSTQTTLQTDNLMKNATLTVYNSHGQTVKQIKNISGQKIALYRDNLPSGMYFIRLTQDNKIITTEKLIITD